MNYSQVRGSDEVLLASRILIALLFLIFGWQKLLHYSETVQMLAQLGTPWPPLATVIASIVEFFVSIAIMLGVALRPLTVLLAIYTLAAALIAHHYWTMTGMTRFEAEINFYKNISIIGGLLALYVASAGRYTVDRVWRKPKASEGAPAHG